MLGMAVMNKRSGGRGGVIINTASQLGELTYFKPGVESVVSDS